jgi:tetratricopeptide (TPR) repeat protein
VVGAVALPREASSPTLIGALNNLSVVFDTTDANRMEELQLEASREAERFGDANMARFLRGNMIATRFVVGRWEEAISGADAFIAECEQGSAHYLESPARENRGYIRLARGHHDDALVDFRRSLELAREAGDPQQLIPALIRCAWADILTGRVSEARAAFAEALPLLRRNPAANWTLPEVALDLDEVPAVREILRALPSSTSAASMAMLDRAFVRASQLFAASGAVTFEAEAHLRAAEQFFVSGASAEGAAELEKALAFYRTVGATFYIERCEALLREAKTA